MLDMASKLAEAGVTALPFPEKSTFPDGRLSTKEACKFAHDLCVHRGITPPTPRMFRWHLKHGTLPAEVLPEAQTGPRQPTYAVKPGDVITFVDELEKEGRKMRVTAESQRGGAVTRRRPPGSVENVTARGYTSHEALVYVQRKVGRSCQLNSTTFSFYVAYGLIPSRWEGKQRMLYQRDLDAFLKAAPDGVHANHLTYETTRRLGPDQMSMAHAYEYYASVDPSPISLNTFRSLAAASIIQAVRQTNHPKSPVMGFNKREIDAFLALRQRIMEANAGQPATKSFLTRKEQEQERARQFASPAMVKQLMDEALERARPALEKARRELEARDAQKGTIPEGPPGRWAPIKEAYAYYREKSPKPFTASWFQNKCYTADLFVKRVTVDERPNNPTGKKYLIDLDSVDAHLAPPPPPPKVVEAPAPPKKPAPDVAWPIEKAYYKFHDLIPPNISLLQFKKLVKKGTIKSVVKATGVRVRFDAVEAYFDPSASGAKACPLRMGEAYDYYCTRCQDPVAKAHFSRWVTGGTIAGSKNDEGVWVVTTGAVDEFIDAHPTGRLRTNRNSRAALGNTGTRQLTEAVARVRESVAAEKPGSMGVVSVSLSSYGSRAEMKKAVEVLTRQGFTVDVKP